MGTLLEVFHAGVDHKIEGNGGPMCTGYLEPQRRILETTIAVALSIFWGLKGFPKISVPKTAPQPKSDPIVKRFLLVTLCIVYGIEIGFKLSSKTMIYMLNPCHVITLMEIYLLSARPSPTVTKIFRFNIHCLYGPLLALVFPILNTRLLPFETQNYYIQHILIILVPLYLLTTEGVFTTESFNDWSYSRSTISIQFFYHFVVLQGLGMLSEANLNNMVCPAISDPFSGINYRIWAMGHQTLLIGFTGKLYTTVCKGILRLFGHSGNYDDAHHQSKAKNDGKHRISEHRLRHEMSNEFNVVNNTFWSHLGNWCSLDAWKSGVRDDVPCPSTNGHVEHND